METKDYHKEVEAPHYALPRRALNSLIRLGPTVLGAGLGSSVTSNKKGKVVGGLVGGGLGEVLGRRAYNKKIVNDIKKGNMYKVKSSMISDMVDAPHGLYVIFNTGKLYRYPRAGKKERAHLLKQESVGRTFNKDIKGKYEYQKL